MSFRNISNLKGRSAVASRALVVLALASGLAACGGGGEDETTPEAHGPQAEGVSAPSGNAATATTWVPKVTDTFHLQLQGTINTNYKVTAYDIDLFDSPDSVLNTLRSQGKRVICYFSAGSAEDWREDYSKFKAADKGKPLDGWPGEYWVDTRSTNVRNIMKARMDKAKTRGCDALDFDNVDEHQQDSGFPLTSATQLDYNKFLANEAHARGMKAGLKNDIDQLSSLTASFDFAVNEQCHVYNECDAYKGFIAAGKPVFNAEYKKKWHTDAVAREQMCATSRAMNMRTVVYPLLLNDKYRDSCD